MNFENQDTTQCFTYFLNSTNNTRFLSNVYEGIPETLLMNWLTWLLLISLFTLLRKHAWNYGRLTLMQISDNWMNLFYGSNLDKDSNNENDQATQYDSILKNDKGAFSWIYLTLKLTDEKILMRRGKDALHYISFQKNLIFLMIIITTVSLTVILPVNFQGNLQGNITTFGHTTISNLEPLSPLLWVHLLISILYIPLVIHAVKKSSGYANRSQLLTNTIMVTNISTKHRSSQEILNYFRLLYPDVEFISVELAYNVAKLNQLVEKFTTANRARLQAEAHLRKTNVRIKVNPIGCHYCLKCVDEQDAILYYINQEKKLLDQIDQERAKAFLNPLGIAFVTVSSCQHVDHIVKNFKPGTYREWYVTYAPEPNDIYWENISVSSRFWYMKAIIINFILFLVLFFITTPALVVNIASNYKVLDFVQKGIVEKVNPYVSEFMPTLLMWTMSALMPVIVAYSDEWLQHWTRSKRNHAIMTKTFSFLLFMVLILPSLSFTSAEAFFRSWLDHKKNETLKWECVFLPDKGAFFINYVITSSFIGTALELIRFPELFMYVSAILISKSTAELVSIKQRAILTEFPFGIHYAWTLVIFTVVFVYSLICPLITPFGLVYLLLKHFVDRYNLYFTYNSSHMSSKIHATAVQMVQFSLFILLTIMISYTTLRSGIDSMVILLICAALMLLCYFLLFKSYRDTNMKNYYMNSSGVHSVSDYKAPVLHTNYFNQYNQHLVNFNQHSMALDSDSVLSYGSNLDSTSATNIII